MKTIYKFMTVALIALLPVTYAGCKKDDDTKKAKGMMLNLGNPSADGCGWVIRIDHVDYSPQTLDDTFKKDSLRVNVTYTLLQTRFQCGLAANIGLSQISIKHISKR